MVDANECVLGGEVVAETKEERRARKAKRKEEKLRSGAKKDKKRKRDGVADSDDQPQPPQEEGAAKRHKEGETPKPAKRAVEETETGMPNSPRLQPTKAKVVAETPESFRLEHQVTVLNQGDTDVHPMTQFDQTPFSEPIRVAIARCGFEKPSPVQAQAWPVALQGRDIISVAKTGSGKTCGFLLPCFHKILTNTKPTPSSSFNRMPSPSLLVLAPTRELACQILDEANKFGRGVGIKCVCVYGGSSKYQQLSQLRRGVDVLVATPGRLIDLITANFLTLEQAKFLVLDEADRMLDMGFLPQINEIVETCPAERQTLFFTATWPKEVQSMASKMLTNPVHITLGSNSGRPTANKSITQNIMVMDQRDKTDALLKLLKDIATDVNHPKTLVFVSQKRVCDELTNHLWEAGFAVDSLHGDRTQWERTKVTNQFKSGEVRLLIATDVAGRGLDVKDVEYVLNYDFAESVEDYVHRIGRTGRAGATGKAFTFFTRKDSRNAADLVNLLKEAEQVVPPELEALVQRRGGFSSGGGRWGGRGGRGGRGGGFRRGGGGFSRGRW